MINSISNTTLPMHLLTSAIDQQIPQNALRLSDDKETNGRI